MSHIERFVECRTKKEGKNRTEHRSRNQKQVNVIVSCMQRHFFDRPMSEYSDFVQHMTCPLRVLVRMSP